MMKMFPVANRLHLLPKAADWLALLWVLLPHTSIAQVIEHLQPKPVAVDGIFKAAPSTPINNTLSSVRPGVRVVYRNNNIKPPLLLLDGQIISEQQLLLLDPNKIKRIDVIKDISGNTFFCSPEYGGALIIHTE